MDRRPRTSGKRIAQIAAAIVAGIAGASFLWVQAVAKDQWARMETRLAEIDVERRADPVTRPVLRGSPEPGNAWDLYGAALASAPTLRQAQAESLYFYGRGPTPNGGQPASLSAMEAWAAPADAALEQLRAGTRRADVRPTLRWDRRFTPLVAELEGRGAGTLTNAAVVKAHGFLERDRSEEAVTLLLDLAQFGRDALQGTSQEAVRTGNYLLDAVERELRKALVAKRLSISALQRLDRELDLLDRGWPDGGATLRNQLLAFGRGCAQEAEQGSLMYLGWRSRDFRSWRWGYSARFRAASTFLRADAAMRKILAGNSRPPELYWPDSVIDDAFSYASVDPGKWERTALRLIRVGARYQQADEVLDLADPYGDRFKTLLADGRLKVWSVGYDGADDGGQERRDIVLEVDR